MESALIRANRIGRPRRGLAHRRQLREEGGVSTATIRRNLRAGIWMEPYPSVIDLGTHERSWRRDVAALLLAAGPDACWASHRTAAHLHGFLDVDEPSRIDVLVPRGRHAAVAGTPLHTTRSIGVDEVTERRGLACTTPARTLLDLGATTAPAVLERYLANLARRNPAVVDEVVALTDRHRRVPGRRRLLDVVARLPGDVAKLGSPLEVLGVQRLIRLGAPAFELQYHVKDPNGAAIKRVDVAWPAAWAIVEFDGADYHDLVGARAADAAVRARLRALGWHVEVVRRGDIDGASLRNLVRRLRRELG